MSCVVAYKWTSNPQDASVDADGTVDWSRAKAALSDYDAVAVEYGRQLAAQYGEVVGISVGSSAVASSMAKKAVLSRGLDRAVVVADDAVAQWNATEVGCALADLVRGIGDVEIVITGDASIDEGAQLMPALIAGALGWPCFEDITSIEKDGAGLVLTQLAEQGSRTITVSGPAVVSVTSDATAVKVPGMKDILQAGKKPLETVAAVAQGAENGDVTVSERLKPEHVSRQATLFSGEDAEAQLVAALRENGIL